MKVSVVIPTYKRRAFLVRCLQAILGQAYNNHDYEIIVADDALESDTEELIIKMARQSRISLKYLPVTGAHGPAAARNIGWNKSNGEIVAFTDDDCVPTLNWLQEGTAAFRSNVDVVKGRVVMPLDRRKPLTDYELNSKGIESAEFVTANCFIKRSVLQDIGGFDQRFRRAWREDSDLHFSMIEKGLLIIYEPKAVVLHPLHQPPWGISILQQKNNLYEALLFKKHPLLYRRKQAFSFPWDYYVAVISFALTFVCLAGRVKGMAYFLFFIWLCVTMAFAWKRLRFTSKDIRHAKEMIITSIIIPFVAIYWRIMGAIKFKVLFF